MEVSSLLSFQRPFLLHSSSSLSFLSLALPISIRRNRESSLVARAELPESGDGPSSTDAKKPAGFGGVAEAKRKSKKGKEKGTFVRRSPIERPSLLAGQDEGRPSEGEQVVNESAFLLTWLGLGLLILVEGIVLAVSDSENINGAGACAGPSTTNGAAIEEDNDDLLLNTDDESDEDNATLEDNDDFDTLDDPNHNEYVEEE